MINWNGCWRSKFPLHVSTFVQLYEIVKVLNFHQTIYDRNISLCSEPCAGPAGRVSLSVRYPRCSFFLYSHSFNFPFGRVPPCGIVWELKNGLRLDCLLNSPEGPWLPQWVEIIYKVIFSCTCIFTDCLKHWCCEIMKSWKFVQGLFLVWMKSLAQNGSFYTKLQ